MFCGILALQNSVVEVRMAHGARHWWLLLGALSAGCSNAVPAPTGGLDGQMPGARVDSPATPAESTGAATVDADACSAAASWQAHRDLSFDSASPRAFADAVNPLIRAQNVAPLSVSNHMEPDCVWMVAFSAADDASAGAAHAATFTKMFRHPAGLWTAAPQASGWIRVVDADAARIWIPISDVTGSAMFGGSGCSALSTADASATVPPSAAALAITTSEGPTTLGALLGPESSPGGWQVHFTFSGNVAQ
jgi:hypothetical protein